jgi:GINS complex subunit 4
VNFRQCLNAGRQIEKYARYITSNAEVQTRLTAAEREHASRHADLTDRHFNYSVLQSLPEPQQHLDDETPYYMPPMSPSPSSLPLPSLSDPAAVSTPDVTRPVFVHALEDCPPVTLPE